MFILVSIIILIVLIVILFTSQKQFGKLPSGPRLEEVKNSPNYKDGAFQNLSHTPALTEGVTYMAVLKEFFLTEKKRVKPKDIIPSVKTDLNKLKAEEDVVVWFGHSSYFIQVDGKKILVDPVLNGNASPLSFTTKAFKGADIYSADDMPEIDYLFITHDHWDHMDYQAMIQLKPKIRKVICGLGVGEHFERWNFDPEIIIEKDWNETFQPGDGFTVHTVPARHFSGRSFFRNKSLWLSYVLITPTTRLFIGGDSGYDSHFAEVGEKYGPFDLAFLENGQYDKSWKYIHMMPGEVLQAALDLRAKRILPVHSSKFSLGNHAWDDPLEQITLLNKEKKLAVITPMIGEVVYLKDASQQFSQWWKGIE